MFDHLFNDPVAYLTEIALMAFPFLYGIIFHELAHGYAALALGDPTARKAGRLTLNPVPHVDPAGAVIFVLAGIGWAKPVPVHPGYFRNPVKGMMLVSIAGPMANFAQACLWALLFHFLGSQQYSSEMLKYAHIARSISYYGVFINLLLGFFNLLPIPPMDGSHLLAGVLPRQHARTYMSLARYGMVVVILLAVLGILSKILLPLIRLGIGALGLPVFI